MNEGRPKFIYHNLSSPIPMCSLITSEELKQARLIEDGLTIDAKKHFQYF